jgi:hypothetical protein
MGFFVNTFKGLLKKVLGFMAIPAHSRQIAQYTVPISANELTKCLLIALTMGF